MGRFFGKVGYSVTEERMTSDNPPQHTGIFEDTIVERNYYGDVVRNNTGWQSQQDSALDNLTINSSISIMADAFAYQNFFQIKYVEWMGAKWKVTSIEPQRPRIILTLGGLYHGDED